MITINKNTFHLECKLIVVIPKIRYINIKISTNSGMKMKDLMVFTFITG